MIDDISMEIKENIKVKMVRERESNKGMLAVDITSPVVFRR